MTELIAQGSYGSVYKGLTTPQNSLEEEKEIAVKLIKLEEYEKVEDLAIEFEVMRKCVHPNIVQYFDGWFINNDILIIAMELCDGGSASDIYLDLGRPFTEDELRVVSRDTLLGLQYMLTVGYLHRDIKGANILLKRDGTVKIIDFGVCGRVTPDRPTRRSFVGTPNWMAPEVIATKDGYTYSPYDFHADVWSFGATILELANAAEPYDECGQFNMGVLNVIVNGPPPALKKPKQWSRGFKDFLYRCLQKDPKQRWAYTELSSHQWLQKIPSGAEAYKVLSNLVEDYIVAKNAACEAKGVSANNDGCYEDDDDVPPPPPPPPRPNNSDENDVIETGEDDDEDIPPPPPLSDSSPLSSASSSPLPPPPPPPISDSPIFSPLSTALSSPQPPPPPPPIDEDEASSPQKTLKMPTANKTKARKEKGTKDTKVSPASVRTVGNSKKKFVSKGTSLGTIHGSSGVSKVVRSKLSLNSAMTPTPPTPILNWATISDGIGGIRNISGNGSSRGEEFGNRAIMRRQLNEIKKLTSKNQKELETLLCEQKARLLDLEQQLIKDMQKSIGLHKTKAAGPPVAGLRQVPFWGKQMQQHQRTMPLGFRFGVGEDSLFSDQMKPQMTACEQEINSHVSTQDAELDALMHTHFDRIAAFVCGSRNDPSNDYQSISGNKSSQLPPSITTPSQVSNRELAGIVRKLRIENLKRYQYAEIDQLWAKHEMQFRHRKAKAALEEEHLGELSRSTRPGNLERISEEERRELASRHKRELELASAESPVQVKLDLLLGSQAAVYGRWMKEKDERMALCEECQKEEIACLKRHEREQVSRLAAFQKQQLDKINNGGDEIKLRRFQMVDLNKIGTFYSGRIGALTMAYSVYIERLVGCFDEAFKRVYCSQQKALNEIRPAAEKVGLNVPQYSVFYDTWSTAADDNEEPPPPPPEEEEDDEEDEGRKDEKYERLPSRLSINGSNDRPRILTSNSSSPLLSLSTSIGNDDDDDEEPPPPPPLPLSRENSFTKSGDDEPPPPPPPLSSSRESSFIKSDDDDEPPPPPPPLPLSRENSFTKNTEDHPPPSPLSRLSSFIASDDENDEGDDGDEFLPPLPPRLRDKSITKHNNNKEEHTTTASTASNNTRKRSFVLSDSDEEEQMPPPPPPPPRSNQISCIKNNEEFFPSSPLSRLSTFVDHNEDDDGEEESKESPPPPPPPLSPEEEKYSPLKSGTKSLARKKGNTSSGSSQQISLTSLINQPALIKSDSDDVPPPPPLPSRSDYSFTDSDSSDDDDDDDAPPLPRR